MLKVSGHPLRFWIMNLNRSCCGTKICCGFRRGLQASSRISGLFSASHFPALWELFSSEWEFFQDCLCGCKFYLWYMNTNILPLKPQHIWRNVSSVHTPVHQKDIKKKSLKDAQIYHWYLFSINGSIKSLHFLTVLMSFRVGGSILGHFAAVIGPPPTHTHTTHTQKKHASAHISSFILASTVLSKLCDDTSATHSN